MSFQTAEKLLKIDKVGGLGRPTGATVLILWRVGGTRRCQQRLLESDRNWQESAESIPNALLPARGAADILGPGSPRASGRAPPPEPVSARSCFLHYPVLDIWAPFAGILAAFSGNWFQISGF